MSARQTSTPASSADMEKTIARCRVILSVFALIAVYVDPTRPTLLPALQLRGGSFTIDPYALAALGAHLVSSVAICVVLAREVVSAGTIAAITTWTDVLFAAAIAAFTEGISSPFYVFFVFAVAASGFRWGRRRTIEVIAAAIGLYLSLILVSEREVNFYIMRPVYLALVGYLIAYLGDQRLRLEAELHRLEGDAERARIAATMHDGSLQTLVAVSLGLEGCRDLLLDGRGDEAAAELSALQDEIVREYEELRGYLRDLAGVKRTLARNGAGRDPSIAIDAHFAGSPAVVDEVLQIARAAIGNVTRHASARSAAVSARREGGRLVVAIDDDGVGFAAGAALPWSIASRVKAVGGELRLVEEHPGAHLRITL